MAASEIAFEQVLLFLSRFDRAVNALQQRPMRPFEVEDESDVRDLAYAALKPLVSDLQKEDPTGKFASKSGRLDLSSKALGMAVEIKATLKSGRATVIPSECRERLAAYGNEPWVKHLVFFLHDPLQRLKDPDAIQLDLAKAHAHGERRFEVHVVGTGLPGPTVVAESKDRPSLAGSDQEAVVRLSALMNNRPATENRKRIDFRNTDESLGLQPGTTRRLIKGVFQKYYVVENESDESILFSERQRALLSRL